MNPPPTPKKTHTKTKQKQKKRQQQTFKFGTHKSSWPGVKINPISQAYLFVMDRINTPSRAHNKYKRVKSSLPRHNL